MKLVRKNPPPYGSAHDLPCMIEMRQMMFAMKWFALLLRPDQRKQLRDLREEIRALNDLVDRFYDVLGDRHWIFTENLPVPEMRALLSNAVDPLAAEAQLIEVISDRVKCTHWRSGLFGHEEMRARDRPIERAWAHYFAGEWDSCALMLITVMDGFISDVEPEHRRGLHARKPEEMAAARCARSTARCTRSSATP